jgi:hypothetical protein
MHVISRHLDHALVNPIMTHMRRLDYLYASSLGFLTAGGVKGGCRRSEWFRMRGTQREVPETPSGLRTALYGGACGDCEVELAKEARIYVDDEVAVIDQKHRISGRIDLIVLDPEATTDPLIGIELKSVQGYASQKKGLTLPDYHGIFTPRDKDLAQASFYADFYKDNIKTWAIRYLDRGLGYTHDHPLVILDDGSISANNRLTGRNIAEVYAWTTSVLQHLEAGTPPERDFTLVWTKDQCKAAAQAGEFAKTDTDKAMKGHKLIKGDWQCRYCRYPFTCMSDVVHPYDFTTQSALNYFLKK